MFTTPIELLLTALAALLGWGSRAIMTTLTWRKIRREAEKSLRDPTNSLHDREIAVRRALISHEGPRIKKQSTLLPPFSTDLPRKPKN